MKKYINDKSPFPQSLEELDGVVLNFEGHDRPRYVYPLNEEAGYLGLESMDKPWHTPQFVSIDAGGTLESAKYYSIIVVPIKADITAGGLPIYGEASPYSIPKTPAAASKKITYTIPTHPQFIIKECGITELFSSFTITDSFQTWTASGYVGATLKNVETGKLYTITANTATTVTATNAIFSAGDRYQILERTVTARAIYAAEMTNASDVSSSSYYLRDIINDNTTTTYELLAFAESADSWDFSGNNLPPPNASAVKQLASLVFCGGGISESRGKAKIDTTTANTIQSAEDDTGTVGAVSKIEDDTQTLTPDALIGMSLLNEANGAVEITDNTATEIYPALIGTTRFYKDDKYFVVDPSATPDLSDTVDIVTSTTAIGLTPVATGVPVYTGTFLCNTYNNPAGWRFDSVNPSQYVGMYVTLNDNTYVGECLSAFQHGDYPGAPWYLNVRGVSYNNPPNGTPLKIYSAGGMQISEHVGKFVLDGSSNILGRVLSNSTVSLYLNAAHGLSITDAFDIVSPEVSSLVTFPTSFKVAGKTWTPDEHAGRLIDFSATANKTILSNNADSIALTDISMPTPAETFSILSATMTVSNPYSRSTDAGAEVKIARYTIAGDLADANALPEGTYAGDYATVTGSGETGNNIASLEIVRVDPDGKWIEVENDSLVAGAANIGATLTITRNHITGNVSGDDKTYFTEGMVDARVKFASSGEKVFKVVWVDPIKQALGIDELYTDPVTADAAFEVFSNYPLYYSQSRNPHAWGAANIIDIYDIIGFSSVGNSLLVFCKTTLWRVDVESLGAAPVLISDNIRCPAQFSIVRGEKYTLFYDGTGISLTDGVTAQSITAYKTRDYLAGINKEFEANIRGVYDRENKRFEFVFPMSDETQNNYGLYITEDTWNCYPFMRPDCNALWTNYDAGRLLVYHGTSGELEGGDGKVWKHSGVSDATTAQEGVVASVAGQVISLVVAPICAVSDMVTIYPATSGGEYLHAIVKEVSGTDITLDASYDVSGLVAGDLVLFGHIPFDYGIKWTDFASPQYRHQVRAVHIDLSEATGKLYVDHFLDMNETAVSTSEFDVTPSTTKIVVPFRMGKSYKYGFRLRGYTSTGIKISSFEIMYDTQA